MEDMDDKPGFVDWDDLDDEEDDKYGSFTHEERRERHFPVRKGPQP